MASEAEASVGCAVDGDTCARPRRAQVYRKVAGTAMAERSEI